MQPLPLTSDFSLSHENTGDCAVIIEFSLSLEFGLHVILEEEIGGLGNPTVEEVESLCDFFGVTMNAAEIG